MRLVSLYHCQYTKWVGPVNIGALLLFPGHLISLTEDVEWPARSPDLSPCDVFLWQYLKEKVFRHRPRSLEDLKERIQQEIDSIPPELTRRVMKNFRERLQQCVANDGCLMSDRIFKTHLKTVFNILFRNIFNLFSRWLLSCFYTSSKSGRYLCPTLYLNYNCVYFCFCYRRRL